MTSDKTTKVLWINQVLMNLRRRIKRAPGGRTVAHWLTKIGVNWIVKSILKLNRGSLSSRAPMKNKPVPDEIKRAVNDAIEDDIHELERLTHRDLSEWRRI